MRWMMQSALMLILITVVPLSVPAQHRDHSLSGRLVFNGNASCERVQVELEVSEMQVVDSTYSDPACAFKFTSVAVGSYLIHVDIDGYQEIHQSVEIFDGSGAFGTSIVQMIPVAGRRSELNRAAGPAVRQVIDVSEVLDRYPRKAQDLYRKAQTNRKKGNRDQAVNRLEEALKIAPDFYQAHNDIGVLYKEAGRLEDAEEHFMRAHQLNRNTAEPLVNLSSLYLDENKPERAIEVSQEAVQTNGRYAPALFNLGLALYKMSRLEKAEIAFKRALELAPKMFQIHLALANVYMRLKNFDGLVEQLDSYLKENPNAQDREQIEKLREQVVKGRGDGF